MKYSDFKSFREYDRKVFRATNIPKEIKKSLGIDKLEEPFYGILYNDYQCGASFRILGNESKIIKDEMLIIRSSSFEEMEFEHFDGKKAQFESALEEINKGYYDEHLDAILNDKKLDIFRYKEYPFDVRVLLFTDDKIDEMWARLITKMEDDDNLYIAELLNTSTYDENYVEGTTIGIEYHKLEDGEALIVNGIIELDE